MNNKVQSVSLAASASGLVQPDDLEAFSRAQEGLQAEGPEWVIFARGLHHEKNGSPGERIPGKGTDETGIRGMYRYWPQLMSVSEPQFDIRTVGKTEMTSHVDFRDNEEFLYRETALL